MDDSTANMVTEYDLESIIDQLVAGDATLPVDAIEQARKHPREITPLLIGLIEDATRDCRQGYASHNDGHFFATYLLAEFRATEAWPAVRDAISLPGEMPFDLYDDAITEDFDHIISALVGDRNDELDALIADSAINLYVRWQAADAMLYQIHEGLLTRDEAIRRLSQQLQLAIERKDEIAEGLVLRLDDLGAASELPLIERAFADDLIDPQMVTVDEVRERIVKGEQTFETTMSRLRRPDDLISHWSQWAAFQGDEEGAAELDDGWLDDMPPFLSDDQSDTDLYLPDNETTVRNQMLKVGRNERCPCGSGRKFKKCCGRNAQMEF